MSRLLAHAGALVCALAVAVMCLVLTRPTAYEFIGELAALGLLAFGLCLSRTNRGGLIAAGLAAAGLLVVAFAMPAQAGPAAKYPPLHALELPAASAGPVAAPAPQEVVVKVAQPDTAAASVAVPLNEWAALARNTIISVLLALFAFAKNKLPAPIVWALKAYGEQKLIEQAVAFGINAVPGASKNAPLSFDVGSPVLAHGLQWVIDNVPGLIVHLMGGEDAIKAKIFAALNLEADANAAAYGVKVAA